MKGEMEGKKVFFEQKNFQIAEVNLHKISTSF